MAMKISKNKIKELKEIAKELRRDILCMTTNAHSGHPGGSMSCIDILVTLFFARMKHDPENPNWEERDRFILSKGHAAPALYAVLAKAGYFPKKELNAFRRFNCMLQGHPDMLKTPGVENSSGSLGQGLSIANGIALAAKLDGKQYKIYALLGDGESQEGQIWEAAMTAAHYKLDNICAFLDFNGLQIDGEVRKIKSIEPIQEKWEAFGWHTKEIDGHSFEEIWDYLEWADKSKGKPSMCIARTIKGKGISFMENVARYHGIPLTEKELERALKELN
jgi:transketolase